MPRRKNKFGDNGALQQLDADNPKSPFMTRGMTLYNPGDYYPIDFLVSKTKKKKGSKFGAPSEVYQDIHGQCFIKGWGPGGRDLLIECRESGDTLGDVFGQMGISGQDNPGVQGLTRQLGNVGIPNKLIRARRRYFGQRFGALSNLASKSYVGTRADLLAPTNAKCLARVYGPNFPISQGFPALKPLKNSGFGARKKPPSRILNKARKLKIKLTVARNGKRYYKSAKLLEKQIINNNKSKRKLRKPKRAPKKPTKVVSKEPPTPGEGDPILDYMFPSEVQFFGSRRKSSFHGLGKRRVI